MNRPIFFSSERIKIIQDDTLTTQEIPEASIDLIVTSPPYNVDIHYNSHNERLTLRLCPCLNKRLTQTNNLEKKNAH